MRDFLDNLIARHVDAVPQIKPRLPSIFEPEVSHGEPKLAVQDGLAPEIEETVPRAPRVRMEATTPSEAEATKPPSGDPAIHSRTLPSVVAPGQLMAAPVVGGRQEKRTGNVVVNEKPTLTAPTGEEDLGRKILSGAIVPAMEQEAVTGMRPTQAAFSLREERKVPQLNPELQRAEEPNEKVAALSARRMQGQDLSNGIVHARREEHREYAGANREENADIRPTILPSATMISPVVSSAITPERPTSQPEPVINVTIGRIEVRATASPQKPTPKPESRTPVMGLEEYLRRRSGGHDR